MNSLRCLFTAHLCCPSASALDNQSAVGNSSEIWRIVPRKPNSASRSRTLTPGAQLRVAFIHGGSNHSLPGTLSGAAENKNATHHPFFIRSFYGYKESLLPSNHLQTRYGPSPTSKKLIQLQQPAPKKSRSIHQWKKNQQGRRVICTDHPALLMFPTTDTHVTAKA